MGIVLQNRRSPSAPESLWRKLRPRSSWPISLELEITTLWRCIATGRQVPPFFQERNQRIAWIDFRISMPKPAPRLRHTLRPAHLLPAALMLTPLRDFPLIAVWYRLQAEKPVPLASYRDAMTLAARLCVPSRSSGGMCLNARSKTPGSNVFKV